MPAQRRKSLEVWSGDGWMPYPEVDTLLRHGIRLTEDQALALLNLVRDRLGSLSTFTPEDGRTALRARLRRADVKRR
jgi:hypothetical protein